MYTNPYSAIYCNIVITGGGGVEWKGGVEEGEEVEEGKGGVKEGKEVSEEKEEKRKERSRRRSKWGKGEKDCNKEKLEEKIVKIH